MPLDEGQALILTRLMAQDLETERQRLDRYDKYYDGEHPLAFASAKFRAAFGGLFDQLAQNWCPLVVSAVLERLAVVGFRARGADGTADSRAWDIWQHNYLDADSKAAHTDALVYGRSYLVVGPGDEGEPPIITVESPLNLVHRVSGANRRRRTAALRLFLDDDRVPCATLYLPDEVWRWRRAGGQAQPEGDDTPVTHATWEARPVEGRPWPEPNPLGVVPVVPLLARPRLGHLGRSELHEVIPVQNMVNKQVADLLVASEYTAMPQRWATGLEIETDPNGQPRQPFPDNSRLWQAEDDETRFGQFQAGDLKGYVDVLTAFKQDIATLSRTPPHYFYLGGQFPSGESIKSAEAGLVAKATDHQEYFGEAWEEALRIAMAIDTGDPDILQQRDSEAIWRDPEYRTEGEHVDATQKKAALGVPQEQLWEDLGYSPQQIARFRELNAAGDTAGRLLEEMTRQGTTAPPIPEPAVPTP